MTIISAVLFGSQVSGGSDRRSDKDLLVVCKPEHKKTAIRKYAGAGYSVSAYTPMQLEHMKQKGSLFLQHLKRESKVLYDDGGAFKHFIDGCHLVPPSSEEIKRSVTSLVNALKSPDDYGISWWLSDYLFVLSRDYFIKRFARDGRVLFNAVHLSREIEKEFGLERTDAETFLDLRKCKSIYRGGEPVGVRATLTLSAWRDILTKILGIEFGARLSDEEYLFDRAIDDFESTYELLRYIESLRIMFPNIRCEESVEYHVKKMILNPNHYSSTSVNGKKFLSPYLLAFRNKADQYANENGCIDHRMYSASAEPILAAGCT